jgi:hypothetical protein
MRAVKKQDISGVCRRVRQISRRRRRKRQSVELPRRIRAHGVPKSVYADGRNMYHLEPGREHNFFTNMCRLLGIVTIRAHSPQAKGRVERANGTHQNRLVPLLELRGVRTAEDLNDFIPEYEQSHNRRFAHLAPDGDAHRPLPTRVKSIEQVCWTRVERTINNDWTVRYDNLILQIPRWSSFAPAKGKVTVRETISGAISISYRDKSTSFNKVATF